MTSSLPALQETSPFYGPPQCIGLRGKRRCHLVLIANSAVNHADDFKRIAAFIRDYDPKISTTVVENRLAGLARLVQSVALPTLVVSLVPLARFRPVRGNFLSGRSLSKSEEYTVLEKAGFSVPKWQLLKHGEKPDLSEYGSYVVTKPDVGMRGALVKIKKSSRVGSKSKKDWSANGQSKYGGTVTSDRQMLAQKFIYTGEWPVNYRVTTLFGKVLHSFKQEASRERARLAGPEAFGHVEGERGVSIVASGKGCAIKMNYDEEIIRYGEAAHAAFPNIPLLGFDIVREVPSGKLYILEANAVGYVWHFSSPMGLNMQRENGLNLENQFNGIHKAAQILADKTQELAR